MKKISSKINYTEFDSSEELPSELASLYRKAEEARNTAYAPYSHFHVGAAVLLANGMTVTGSNQENAAYPSGLCAERVAVFAASAHYPGVMIKAIAIAVSGDAKRLSGPVSPCGDCRQVMSEYEYRQQNGINILMPGAKGTIIMVDDIKTLLPFGFGPGQLEE